MKNATQQSVTPTAVSNTDIATPLTSYPTDEAEIIRILTESVVEHQNISDAFEKIRSVVARNEHASEPRHLLLVGDAGCGKSTLCDLIDREFESSMQSTLLGLQRRSGALITSVPSPVTPRSMAAEMLRALGVTRNLGQTTRELTEELLAVFEQTGTRVIVLDEFQHLFSVGESVEVPKNKRSGRGGCTSKQLLEVQDWIKSLIVKSGVTFVLVGQPSITALIRSEPQLARRFTQLCRLSPFALPDSDGPSELGAFVAALIENLILHKKGLDYTEWSASDQESGQRMHLATLGFPSAIKDLVLDACLIARRSGDDTVRLTHFAEAYKLVRENLDELSAIRRAQGDCDAVVAVINPFTAPIQSVQAELYAKAA